jgi:predicted hydrocarbon binding protein
LADQPVCHVNIGFIQEIAQWAMGAGKEEVEVNEIACRAMGDSACRYQVRLVSE